MFTNYTQCNFKKLWPLSACRQKVFVKSSHLKHKVERAQLGPLSSHMPFLVPIPLHGKIEVLTSLQKYSKEF